MYGLALCAGAGGLEIGIGRVFREYRAVCYVEREAYPAAVLAARMEEGRLAPAPIWDDVTTFDGRRWRGSVDCVSAGFPCQPFSQAGKRQADDDSRHLWPHVRRVINGARPDLVFLENVGTLISTRQRDGRPAYMVVRNELERLGYRVAETLVRASDVGAPHQRERVFILGYAKQFRRASPTSHTGMAEAQSGDRSVQLFQRGQDQTVSESRRTGRGFPRDGIGVADADHQRLEGYGREYELGKTSSEKSSAGSCQRGAGAAFPTEWPPGPGDARKWASIIGDDAGLAPALDAASTVGHVRRVADGLAEGLVDRTHRLRALGNGVVPAQAEHAIRLCLEQLSGDK